MSLRTAASLVAALFLAASVAADQQRQRADGIAIAPPTITKAFAAPTLVLGNPLTNTTRLSFTITNPNSVALDGVAFTDRMTPGVGVAIAPGFPAGGCGGGAITIDSHVNLTGATLPPFSSCTFDVLAIALKPGQWTNTTGPVTSTNGGTGNSATAPVTGLAADFSIAQSHSGNAIPGGQITFTITVTNLGVPTSGFLLVGDNVPPGLSLSSVSGSGWGCLLVSPFLANAFVQCTRNGALPGDGAVYPPITVTFDVSPTAPPARVRNTAVVKFEADGNPLNNSADDTVDIGGAIPTLSVPMLLLLAAALAIVAVKVMAK